MKKWLLLLVVLLTVAVLAGCRSRLASQSVPKDEAGNPKKLGDNGFVVLAQDEVWNSTSGYYELGPNFITSDVVLYIFHSLFRDGLSEHERRQLLPLTKRLVGNCLRVAEAERKRLAGDALLREPARRNVVFFAVAQALLTGETPVAEKARKIVGLVEQATQYGEYPEEDYTQYLPRGVYAEDAELARYFRAMKWLSRGILPVVAGGGDGEPEASIKLRQAYLLGELCRREDVRADWQKLYDEISFFAARPDSLTPVEFAQVAERLGKTPDEQWVRAVRAEFAKPEYKTSAIISVLQSAPGQAPSKYVQFMGERYIPDGEIHQQAVFPYVAGRMIPSGLDIGFALFGSERAKKHLAPQFQQHPTLQPVLERLAGRFGEYDETSGGGDLYRDWVGTLRAVTHPPQTEHVPEFARTEAWQDKCLTTALASWTYMRHDFVLYGREPVMPGCAGLDYLVEPAPEVYGRVGKMAEQLQDRGFAGMANLRKLCVVLQAVAQARVEGRRTPRLSRFEGEHWEYTLALFGDWLLRNFVPYVAEERPAVVVDVAGESTAPNRVLHAATGPFNVIEVEDTVRGKRVVYRGLVLSYYEFTQNDMNRLTDKEWEKTVKAGKHRAMRPAWAKTYLR